MKGTPSDNYVPQLQTGLTTVHFEMEDGLAATESVNMFTILFFADRVVISSDLVVSTSFVAGTA